MAKPIFGTMVILRLKADTSNPSLNHDYEIHASVDGTPVIFSWTKKNNYTTEVPTKIEFLDVVGVKKTSQENYAQHLLNAYPGIFEVVGEVEEQLVKQPTVKLSEADLLRKQLAQAEVERKQLEAKIAQATPPVESIQHSDTQKKRGRPKKEKEFVQ